LGVLLAHDLDAALAPGDKWAQWQFYAAGYDHTPAIKRVGVLQLRAESVRMLVSIKVLRGYQLGDDVVLDTEGIAENGWIDRGPVLLKLNSDGKFESSFAMTVSYPK